MSASQSTHTPGSFDLSDMAWSRLDAAIGRTTSLDDRLEVLAQCWGWQGAQVLNQRGTCEVTAWKKPMSDVLKQGKNRNEPTDLRRLARCRGHL